MSINSDLILNIFKGFPNQISEVSEEDWIFFSSKLKREDIPKKTVFLKSGTVENKISFIISGIVRFYILKTDPAKEITFGFCFKKQFISAYDSFLTRKPSLYELESLTNTTVLSISYDDLQEVYNTFSKKRHILPINIK